MSPSSGFQPRGRHLLVDFHGVAPRHLRDTSAIETLLREAARAAGATPVGGEFHHFGPGLGVTGVLLRQSHISIHTWPEHGFAAVDVFMCGTAQPERAVDVIETALQAASITRHETRRG